jgi:hypothetical protein
MGFLLRMCMETGVHAISGVMPAKAGIQQSVSGVSK